MSIYRTKLSKLLPEDTFKAMGESVRQELLTSLAWGARDFWIQRAQETLNTTSRDYVNGIQPVEIKPGRATLALVGELPNLIEKGQEAYDMHDTLLGPNVPVVERGSGKKGKHAKADGNGYYRAIPFRHGTPGTSGAAGPAMGSAYEGHAEVQDAKALGKNIYAAASKLAPSTGHSGGKVKYGERLPEGMAPKLRAHHATDIYAGMVKEQKTYAKATQNQYTTFRTIATGSPGWMRGATPGKHLLKDVQKHLKTTVTAAVKALLEGALPK